MNVNSKNNSAPASRTNSIQARFKRQNLKLEMSMYSSFIDWEMEAEVNNQNFKTLNDETLIQEVKTLAREERRLSHEILLRIQEVERRKLHLDLGFPSILDWLVKDIGYSESAAHRRMQAARLLVAVPKAGEKLKSGEMSLSTLAKVQSVVKQEEKRIQAKIENSFKAELLEQLESKSTREAEKILVQVFPEIAPSTNESLRAVSSDESRLSIILDDEVRKDLERAKELFSHIKHDMTWAEVVAQALKIALDHKDPLRKKAVSQEQALKVQQVKCVEPLHSSKQKKSSRQTFPVQSQLLNQNRAEHSRTMIDFDLSSELAERHNSSELHDAIAQGSTDVGIQHDVSCINERLTTRPDQTVKPKSIEKSRNSNKHSSLKPRFMRSPLPVRVRRYIIQRDGGACQFRDPVTGRMCQSRHQIEVDHIVPVALGGENSIGNLRCLCRRHNQIRAKKTFGWKGSLRF